MKKNEVGVEIFFRLKKKSRKKKYKIIEKKCEKYIQHNIYREYEWERTVKWKPRRPIKKINLNQ